MNCQLKHCMNCQWKHNKWKINNEIVDDDTNEQILVKLKAQLSTINADRMILKMEIKELEYDMNIIKL